MNADVGLWVGVLGGPIAWALDLTIGYALGNARCTQPHTLMWLHALTGLSLAAILASAATAALSPRRNERAQSMAWLGMLMCALFALLVVATGIPRFLLHVCS